MTKRRRNTTRKSCITDTIRWAAKKFIIFRTRPSAFGLTRKNLLRRSIEFNCTPGWAAPELIKFQDHDQSIDIYSLGILIWEVFARDQPFKNLSKEKIFECVLKGERPPIEALETIIPEKIRKLYIKCVQEEKEKRPSIKEVIEILEECYSTEK